MQPYYEKVARLFNGPDAVHPGIILMTRVDCANKVLILGFLIDNLQYDVFWISYQKKYITVHQHFYDEAMLMSLRRCSLDTCRTIICP